jgi:methionine-gamma-lyase
VDKITQRIRDVQHFGEEGGVVPVVDVAATSTFLNPGDMEKAFHGELEGRYLYSRHSNPTVKDFGIKIAAMEGMEAAVGVASGMAAIYSSILQLMPGGGHLISSRTVYGGTYALFHNILPKMGFSVTFVDIHDLSAVESVIRAETKLIYTESMSNPLLRIADLPALGKICKKKNIKFVVDNTFTPMIVTPAQWGADVVIHSCTKYISGMSDLIAGVIVGSQEFIDQLIDVNSGVVMLTGPVMDSRIAHKLYTRLDHLHLRMVAHGKSAAFLASRLQEAQARVIYPGLKSHIDHSLLTKIMHSEFGFGGMLVLDCNTPERALDLANRLQQEKFGLYAVSLGFSRTLMSCPSISTSSEIPENEQRAMGLSPGFLRLSIGYSGNDEIMTDRFFKCYQQR